jgi:hypothetical protein
VARAIDTVGDGKEDTIEVDKEEKKKEKKKKRKKREFV